MNGPARDTRSPEPEAAWELWRQDDNGHRFKIATFASEPEAREHLADYESRHHKQMYWIERASI